MMTLLDMLPDSARFDVSHAPVGNPVLAGNGTLAVGDLLEWVSTATLTGAPDVGGKVVVQHSLGT